MNDTNDLGIPIYLDTNTLLDLLATIDGGFSTVQQITTRTTESSGREASGAAEFGISSLLSGIFRIDLKGSATARKGRELGEEMTTERYHTYGSLMNRLRADLRESGLLKSVVDEDSWGVVEQGSFIEARGKFVPNPLRASLETIRRLIDLIVLSADFQPSPNSRSPRTKKSTKQETQQYKPVQKLCEGMLKDLEPGNSQCYILEVTELGDHRIVMSLFAEYLRDRLGVELPYGQFSVLGKVVRRIDKGDSYNLLGRSALTGVSDQILSTFLDAFSQMNEQGLNIPDITKTVEAPALQVVPVAVFV